MSDALIVRPRPLVRRLSADEARFIGFSAGLPGAETGEGKGNQNLQGQIPAGAVPIRAETPTQYQRNGTAVRIRGFERHPVVQACVRASAEIIAAVPIEVYQKVGEDGQAIRVVKKSHPAQQIFDAPSPFVSDLRLRAFAAIHFLIYGNAVWFLERDTPDGPPKTIRVIQPEDITSVYVNMKGYPVAYIWRDYLGYTHVSPVTDMVHFRDLNAWGIVFGYPRGASALNDIIGDSEASQYTREVVTNHGWPGMIMLMNEESTADDAARARSAWNETQVERGNRGNTAWIGGVRDVKPLGFNLRDLEFPDLRRVNREDICSAFGVDPRMVGITSAAKDAGLSGAQYKEARKRLIQQTIEPMQHAIEAEMNLWLLPEFGDVYARFSPEAMQQLVEDDAETSTRVQNEVKTQLRTIEEGRQALGLEAEFEPEDHLLVSGTGTKMVTVAIALSSAEADPTTTNPDGSPRLNDDGTPQVGGGKGPVQAKQPATGDSAAEEGAAQRPAKPGSGKDLQEAAGGDPNRPNQPTKIQTDTAEKEAKKKERKLRASAGNVLVRGVVLTPDQRRLLWGEFDSRAVKDEVAYKRQALLNFHDERAAVKSVFEQHAAAAQSNLDGQAPGADESSYLPAAKRQIRRMYKKDGPVRAQWTQRFEPLIAGTYHDGVNAMSAKTRKVAKARAADRQDVILRDGSGPFGQENAYIQDAIKRRAKKLADQVGDTTAQGIDDAIELGEKEGWGIAEIARLINDTVFGGDADYRSTMIARTETIGALNQGEYDAALSGDVVSTKEWLTQGDDRVRDTHADCEAEGQIEIADEFETNGMLHPGDPNGDADEVINCRCTLLYYSEGDSAPIEGEDIQEDSEPAGLVSVRRATAKREKAREERMAELIRSVAAEAAASGKTVADVMTARMDRLERAAAETKEWLEGTERSRAGGVAELVSAIAKAPAPVVNVEVNLPARGPTKSTRNEDGSVTTEEVTPKHKDG